MLTYNLENRGDTPLYVYLYECIKNDILTQKLATNERLPSKRGFAQHLNISVITVEKAYDQLLLEGFVRSKERSGYYIEDVRQYRMKTEKPLPMRKQEEEHEYFMDFKANRISLSKFPISVWSKYMRQTLSLQEDTLYKPVSYKGVYQLRVAIADYLLRFRGMHVDPERIIIGAGTEYLYGRLLQLLGKESIFAMESPGYAKISKISESYGNRWEQIPIDTYGLDVDALEESGADVVHVSPANHFPTGRVMSVTRRVQLFQWANRIKKRYIIEDDYDSEFRYNGKMILPLYASDVNQKVIYINTFSKTLVPTLRISYMILPEVLMKRYEETMSFYSSTVSSFEQHTLARFIADGHFEKHITRMKNYYRTMRAQILRAIESSPLQSISNVEENNAGTHFLLHVFTSKTQDELTSLAKENDMALSFYSDYDMVEQEEGICTLVINYASIRPDQIDDVILRLYTILKKD